jgi:hypothetical protein
MTYFFYIKKSNKMNFKQILIILNFLLCVTFLKAQDPIRKWDGCFDVGFGYGITIQNINSKGGSISGVSAGLQYKDKIGLGFGFSYALNFVNLAGIGADFQYKPLKWLLVKMQMGKIISASNSDYFGGVLSTNLPVESNNFYWKGTIAIRFAQFFYVGITKFQTTQTIATGISSIKQNVDIVTPQLGMNVPFHAKRIKK